MLFKNLIAIGLGGALGSLLRYMAALMLNSAYPYGTLTVNLVGSFFLGLLTGGFYSKIRWEWLRLGMGVGLLGSFTTMSTFSAEIRSVWLENSIGLALGYTVLSVAGGLGLAACGVYLGNKLFKN